ncbi:MAG: fimbrillin family protein [Parabacteroides gordonii]|nr:fimbrillin family protein [Parabacteroides gordonii]
MKQILYIGLLMGAVLLPSCSDDRDTGAVPSHLIRLNTGIIPTTRAALNRFDGETVAFAKAIASGSYMETWQAIATPADTRLLGEQSYPADRSYLYLRGYYPVQALSGGSVLYKLDGQTDLMATVEQKGNLADNFSLSSKTFYFNHLLTQVSLEVRTSREETNELRLARIEVTGSRPEAKILLSTAPATDLPQVLFSGEPQLLTAYIEPVRGGGISLSREAVLLPYTLLVEPEAPLALNIKASLPDGTICSWSGMPVRFDEQDGVSQSGTAYRLTVTLFSTTDPEGTDMSVAASVVPWVEERGSGTVE